MSKKRVAVVIANNFEDVEVTSPVQAVESAGAEFVLIGIEPGKVKGKKGHVFTVDTTFDDLPANAIDTFDMLIIPGGGAPENLRIVDKAVEFTKRFVESGKPVASICHGPQLLISADVLKGRKLTSVNKIRDDVKNAGGLYEDAELVIDGNLITSRTPRDLEAFDRAIVDALAAVPA
ncbi:MAG TPA: type 1 glutamine amidotransferase domain-containing protein [Thermomicrobiales bacterium]|nr:type 1 glutamine amidotransferase domain-containing protein [Thermomicrobiales bacterium]